MKPTRPIESEIAREHLEDHLKEHGRIAEIFKLIYILFAGCPSCYSHLENYRSTVTKR